eukprot:548322_1
MQLHLFITLLVLSIVKGFNWCPHLPNYAQFRRRHGAGIQVIEADETKPCVYCTLGDKGARTDVRIQCKDLTPKRPRQAFNSDLLAANHCAKGKAAVCAATRVLLTDVVISDDVIRALDHVPGLAAILARFGMGAAHGDYENTYENYMDINDNDNYDELDVASSLHELIQDENELLRLEKELQKQKMGEKVITKRHQRYKGNW